MGTLALKPPSSLKEAVAAIISLVVVLAAANLAASGLKTLLDPTVRSSVVGMLFASVPAVYGFSNRALNGFRPKRLEYPELLPWYVTGLFAGACLFAWIQFIAFIVGASLGMASASAGLEQLDMHIIASVSGLATLAITAPASILAGMNLNRSTRGLVFVALLFASILCVALSIFTSWLLAPAFMAELMKQPLQAVVGSAIPAMVVLVFGIIGVGWSALWRERSIGRLAHAARRLKPDQRDEVFSDITHRLAAAHVAEVPAQAESEPAVSAA
ncbi:MAG: hypothetical protein GC155_04775 [Alphaproteobacteria bacterium]|nr:hypothetical protein [Alphaproteobacteria bacterium]